MSTKKPLKDPEEIRKHVGNASIFLYGEFNLTYNGVPRVIVKTENCTYSVVYLARTDKWKVFYPFLCDASEQNRKYFDSLQEVRDFIYGVTFFKNLTLTVKEVMYKSAISSGEVKTDFNNFCKYMSESLINIKELKVIEI